MCDSCGGSVLTIAVLRQLAPAVAHSLWNEGPRLSPGSGLARCPFCQLEMQPKAIEAGTAALCRPCEAVWLDKEASETVKIKAPVDSEPSLSSEELRCPQCGAPVGNTWDETCKYCGAGLHAPVKVVVLPEGEAGPWGTERRGPASSFASEVLGTAFRLHR